MKYVILIYENIPEHKYKLVKIFADTWKEVKAMIGTIEIKATKVMGSWTAKDRAIHYIILDSQQYPYMDKVNGR